MTNLEYLEKFITETYGAICFHNAPEDGYRGYKNYFSYNFTANCANRFETIGNAGR